MSRYIDAEKLIAEIERRLKIVEPHKDTFESAAACRQELIWMKEFVVSLLQEQPEVDEPEYGPYARQYPKSKVSKKQPEVDLEKAIEDYYGNIPDDEDNVKAARHFYELGLNARNEK